MTTLDYSEISELVRDSNLKASFWSDRQHHYTGHDSKGRLKLRHQQEVWRHVRNLGAGGGGSVDLQERKSTWPRKAVLRAVKSIRVSDHSIDRKNELCLRELEALIKFSQPRYGGLFVGFLGWYTSPNYIHIAMEYCELGDLQRYLSRYDLCPRGFLPESQVREIASQLLNALLMMHEEKFAHRDLKPANMLFVSHPPNPWRVKLSDFGISKRKGETEQSTLVRGTPSFMPPESLGFLGDPKKIDHYAADMWCFGETLFRMLCGHATFASHAELARYVNGAHSLPKDNLIKLGVSQEAVDVFLSLLALNPSERLTADGVSRHAWMVNNGFVKTHTKQLGETNEVTIDTNKHSLLGTKGYRDDLTQASGLWTTTTTPSGANAPIQAMTTQPTIEENPGPVISSKEGSSIVVNELPNMSESSPCDFIHKGTGYCASANHSPPENMTRQTIKLEDSITGDPKQANTSTEMRTNVSFLQSHTNGCFMAGELTDLEQVINDTASVVSAFTEKSERDQIKLQMLNAPAAKRYKKTMVTLAKNGYLSNRKVTMTMQTLEKMLLEQNKTREARMIYPDAIDIRRKLFGEEDKVAFKLMELYAESLLRQGQFWKAEMIGNRLLNHGEQNWKDDTVGKIATTDLLAVSLYEQGKEEELENVCRTLIALQEAKWGVDNSRTLGTMKLLADALFMQHKHDLAEQVYRDVLRYRKNIPGKRNLLMAKTMVCLAQTLVLQGKIEETDSLIECALKMKRMLKQRESLDEMHFLGKLLYDQKCYSQAEKVLRATISLKKQHLGPKDPVTLRSMDRLSQVLRREMKYSDAEDLLEETIAIKESSIGPKHPSTMQTKALLEKVRTLHRGLEFGRNESIPLESEALVEGA